MKSLLLLSAFIAALAFSCSGQSRGEPVMEYRLSDRAAASWKEVKDDFNKKGFIPCLAQKKVKVSCAGCTAVIVRGVLHIDSTGRGFRFTKTYGRYCGSELPLDVEKCFMNFFETVDFPPELRGLSIQVDLGRGLKC